MGRGVMPRLFYFMTKFTTLDAHVAGEAVRLLVDGGPSVSGRTMLDKAAWLRRHADRMRRTLMLEPRGHAGMQGALLTEPVTPGAHAGVLFMHAAGFPAFSGEGVIAAATLALENNLIHAGTEELLLDTPAGTVQARAHLVHDRVASVTVTGVPSFVLDGGMPVQASGRAIRADVAFGGELYAIVDSESVGVAIDAASGPQLMRAALDISRAVRRSKDIQGTIFTGPSSGSADLRTATVLCGERAQSSNGCVLKRSPGLAGTCALMAVLDAMGLLAVDQTFTHEGILGTTLIGRTRERKPSQDDDPASVIPVVEGSAWPTGRHEFVVDDHDPAAAFEIA
jgi:proline racemase